jgi:hypothetical protein
MNAIGVRDFRGTQDAGDILITLVARGRSDADVLVGQTDVQRIRVGLGMNGNGPDSKLLTGPYHPERNLAPIGHEDLFERMQT